MKDPFPRVIIPSGTVNFPSLCPKCLGKTDLTTYTAKWEGKHIEGYNTLVTRKVQVNVPICKSCKASLLSATRKKNSVSFAIFTPLCWGLLYVLLIFGAATWGSITALFLALLAGMPAAALWFIIEPSKQVNWPLKIVGLNVFSIENNAYAFLFKAANNS